MKNWRGFKGVAMLGTMLLLANIFLPGLEVLADEEGEDEEILVDVTCQYLDGDEISDEEGDEDANDASQNLSDVVAIIENEKKCFKSLEKAITTYDNANDENDIDTREPIKLLKDITIDSQIKIAMVIPININGHSITDNTPDGAFEIESDGYLYLVDDETDTNTNNTISKGNNENTTIFIVEGTLHISENILEPSEKDESTPKISNKSIKISDGGKVILGENYSYPSLFLDNTVQECDDNAVCTTVVGDAVAQVGANTYTSLQEAISAVTSSDETTITLLKNVLDGGGVFITGDLNLNIIIDFNNFTYTAKSPAVGSKGYQTQALHIEKNNKVTLKNGIFIADGTKNKNMKMGIQNYSNLVLDNFTLDGSKLAGKYATSNNFGSLTLKNTSKIIIPNNGVIADVRYGMSESYDNGVEIIFDSSFDGEISGIIEYGAANKITGTDWTGKALIDLSTITNPSLFDNVVFVSSSNHITNLSDQANIKLPDGYMLYSSDSKNYKMVKSSLTVNFNTDGGSNIASLDVDYGSKVTKPANPTKNCNSFNGWYIGDTEYDFNQGVTSDLTLKASWAYTCGSSSGGGGSSSKTTTKTEEPKVDDTKADTTTNEEIELKGEVTTTESNENTSEETSTPDNEFSKEFNDAYNFAFKNGITTMPSIEEADMNAPLTRIAMAKMLSQYAINVLGKTADTSKVVPTFPDVSEQLNKDYNDGVTLAYQLGIMGINIEKFRPYDLVTRAEFGTALSRMLFGLADGEGAYYETHLAKLMEEKIITVDTPNLQELRGYVMIMLMRSASN